MTRWLMLLTCFAAGCSLASPDDPGALVPPTADEDPALPQVRVEVAGHHRSLHLETFGDPSRPALLAFHGGGGNDYRAMLPLRALSDEYFVVLWDARGSGLSERVTRGEISQQSYVDEVAAVKQLFSPDAPIVLAGYSWGGLHASLFTVRHPEAVAALVLIEPAPLSREANDAVEPISFGLGESFVNELLWQVDFLSPADHVELDRKAYAAAPEAIRSYWCDPEHPGVYPMWRHGIFTDITATERVQNDASFDALSALMSYSGPVLVVGSSCGPLDADFQRRHTLPLFASPEFTELDGVSHLDLFTPELVSSVRDFVQRALP